MLRPQRRAELFALLGLTTVSHWAHAQPAPTPAPTTDAGSEAPAQPPAPPVTQGAPAPAPAYPYPPAPYAPGAYPPGQYPSAPYPPPAYGPAPYPPGYAPPPGYYGYPYYGPPPVVPPKPRYPDDAAARTSPFLHITVGGTHWSQGFASFFNVGLDAGLFIAGALRLSLRAQVFPTEPDDNPPSSGLPEGMFASPSEPPVLLYGASVGYALASSSNFVLSPGILAMRTDVGAYGSFVGLGIPFEWVNDSSIRIGFELALGRTFGGEVRAQCPRAPCPGTILGGETYDFNRPAGVGLYGHFQIGLGFNRPKPLPNR